jgi:SAM-dependent methyltransferase
MFESVSKRREMLRAWAAHDADVFRAFSSTIEKFAGKPLSSLRILDVGCGANAPLTLMLHASGCRVTGVDHEIGHRWGLGFRPSRYVAYLKTAGILKTARKAVGELVFDRVYFNELAKQTGLTLTEAGLDLQTMDVTRPALAEGTYDVLHSNATWEHVKDIDAANRSVAAALVPGGLAYIEIHLFPSLSGGHDLPWIVPGRTILGDVVPWQHLRDPAWKAPVVLNRLRERDYRRSFESIANLEIVDWRIEYTEGKDLLTPAIRAALPDYTDAELTTRSIIVIVRRRR